MLHTVWVNDTHLYYGQYQYHMIWAIRKGKELLIVSNETFLKDYIEFFHGSTCRSFAGRSGQRQEIVLDPRCAEKHTLIHEVTFLEETLSNYGCYNVTLSRQDNTV